MNQNEKHDRVAIFDELRGFAVISMVAFHTCYDLAYIYGTNLSLFTDLVMQEIWRCSISWTFLFLAGWMTHFSKNNFKRGGIYAMGAIVIWITTSTANVDIPISFGIIYCMAGCTILFSLLSPLLNKLDSRLIIAISTLLFFLTYRIPKTTYPIEGLAWLGFPSPTFSSGDYYPLIPFFFMYLIGASTARWFHSSKSGYPNWMKTNMCRPLSFIGRHSLVIYLIHQPIVLLALCILLT